jgi:hypothetical protein
MRTKTLLLTAALGLLGAVSSFAQVYSVNAVGYVNKSIATAGYLLVENPLNNGNNQVDTILPGAPDGSIISGWDGALQDFRDPLSSIGGAWFNVDFSPATAVYAPGEGFFLYLAADNTTVTFIGDVPQGNLSNPLIAGYNLVGSQVPQSASFDVLGVSAVSSDGDLAQFWDVANQDYFQPVQFLSGQWYDTNFNPVSPTPEVGEAFFLYRGAPGSWDRTFSVNP